MCEIDCDDVATCHLEFETLQKSNCSRKLESYLDNRIAINVAFDAYRFEIRVSSPINTFYLEFAEQVFFCFFNNVSF